MNKKEMIKSAPINKLLLFESILALCFPCSEHIALKKNYTCMLMKVIYIYRFFSCHCL